MQDTAPQSRITLTYRTTISGQPVDIELPLRLLLLGDFSNGTSVDRFDPETKRAKDLDSRISRSLDGKNLDAVIGAMGISLKLEGVENEINPGERGDKLDITLPVTNLRSFHPDAIARSVPKLSDVQLNAILHHPEFQRLEANWRGVQDLVDHTNFGAGIKIDLLDVSKEELAEDFQNNSSDLFNGALFNKVYIQEFDQNGGEPYAAMIGLYDFSSTPQDIKWLSRMAQVASASHCPFISGASHELFGLATAEEVEAVGDIEALLQQPRFAAWNVLRDDETASYLGLTYPKYVVRLPYAPMKNPSDAPGFTEVAQGDSTKYLWGNSAVLFARNLVKAFELGGWCQAIRGPKGGGLVTGLPLDMFEVGGQSVIKPPVEVAIADYRELELARSGIIPLVWNKNSGDATFFSCPSVKSIKRFMNPIDTKNSQLVANMAYTFSISRLAHYVKCLMRDNIGSTGDAVYIQQAIQSWLAGYVTTVTNPDDLTVGRYPFKACAVTVIPKPGEFGWYDCIVSVLPHIQFEGSTVELRLDVRLGAAA